jgi:hypothetical protein
VTWERIEAQFQKVIGSRVVTGSEQAMLTQLLKALFDERAPQEAQQAEIDNRAVVREWIARQIYLPGVTPSEREIFESLRRKIE